MYLQKFLFFIFIIFSLVSCSSANRQIIGFAFDIDDNLFYLPTKIMIFNKKTKEEIGISTAKYAQIRKLIGKPGKWLDYKIKPNRVNGSYRYFGDQIGDGVNYFLVDLKKAMDENPHKWKALSFSAFQTAMKKQQTAHDTSIITARGHDAKSIVEALNYLKSQGIIDNVPKQENIWAVTNPKFQDRFNSQFNRSTPKGSVSHPSARKAAIIEEILDQICKMKIPKQSPKVLALNGKDLQKFHLWGFSDDDYGNFSKAQKIIQKGLDQGKWHNIKISLYFTGEHDKNHKPHSIVLRPGKAPRQMLPDEENEWRSLIQ